MRRAGLLLLALALQAVPPDPLHRDSPQSSVAAFLAACRAKDYQHAWRYLDVRKLSASQRLQDGEQLAQQLEQILDRDVRFDLANLSSNPEGAPPADNLETVDSFTVDGKPLALQLERVKLRSGAWIWLFTPASIEAIPQLVRWTSDTPVERRMPSPLVSWKFMNTSIWRWLALFFLAALLAGVARLMFRFGLMCMTPALKRVAPHWPVGLLEVLLAPLQLLLVVAGFRAGMEWIAPAQPLRLYLERVAGVLFCSAVAWLAMRMTDLSSIRLRSVLGVRHHSFSASLLPLLSRVVKIVIVALAAAAILSTFGYNTATILAGLGVGGVALALAAQKTVENLFGGVAVITDRPVSIGDFCKFGDQVGTVEDIGLRSTRIRTLGRTLLNVPNGLFSSMTLENYSKRDKMWFHLMLNLRRDTTPSQVRALLESITGTLRKQPKIELGATPVKFAGLGIYSLDLEIFVYFLTTDDHEFARIQQDLFLAILDEVEAAGTALAVPTQAYFAVGQAGQPMPPGRTGPAAPGKNEPSPQPAGDGSRS